jgi:hypothetical protein
LRFFFHIAGGEFFADPEGQEVRGLEEAYEVARSIASDFADRSSVVSRSLPQFLRENGGIEGAAKRLPLKLQSSGNKRS